MKYGIQKDNTRERRTLYKRNLIEKVTKPCAPSIKHNNNDDDDDNIWITEVGFV